MPRDAGASDTTRLRDGEHGSRRDAFHLGLDEAARLSLGLQRRARVNLRAHAKRALIRVSVLVVADLAVFFVMRALIRAIRDEGLLGGMLASEVWRLLPRGYMNGWQFAAALVVGLLATGNYGEGDRRRDVRRLLAGTALAAALPLWMPLWTRGLEPALTWYLAAVGCVWLAIVFERLTVDRAVALVRDPSRDALRAVFVGTPDATSAAAATAAFSGAKDFINLGFVDVSEAPAEGCLGSLDDLVAILQRERADGVVICGYLSDADFQRIVDTSLLAGCRLISLPRAVAGEELTPTVTWRQGKAVIDLTAPTLRAQQLIVKRIVDFSLSLVGLTILSPLFAVVGLLVKLDSRGPVFFRQQRVGQGGRTFLMYKFRTMRNGAEALKKELMQHSIYSDPRLFKLVDDPRITRLGRLLRQTSIDELPQLWNVFRGEMSLVGPRPPVPSEVILYELHHYARFEMKPGITGPWQVNGRNEVTDFEHVVRLESAYIREWSLLKDFAILLRTIPTVLRMRGAH